MDLVHNLPSSHVVLELEVAPFVDQSLLDLRER
jgi:hypothetical protein